MSGNHMGKNIKVLLICLIPVFAFILVYLYISTLRVKGPTQPIVFSHRIHSGLNQIPCQYCHAYTASSPFAGMPSMQKCLGCHNVITGQDAGFYFRKGVGALAQTQQLQEYWEKSQGKGVFNGTQKQKNFYYLGQSDPMPWVRVYFLPDHVRFTHKPHIRRGFECKTCHGAVEEMDILYRVQDLKMGWCVSCHEANARDENELALLKDCFTCHY